MGKQLLFSSEMSWDGPVKRRFVIASLNELSPTIHTFDIIIPLNPIQCFSKVALITTLSRQVVLYVATKIMKSQRRRIDQGYKEVIHQSMMLTMFGISSPYK